MNQAPPLESRTLSVDEFLALAPETVRNHELVDGKLKLAMPTGANHARIVIHLAVILSAFVNPRKLGQLFADGMFRLNPNWAPAPDIAFVRTDRVPADPILGPFPGAPDLAIEVVSPIDALDDIMEKIDGYLQHGVPLVWLIEPRRRRVTIYSTSTAFPLIKTATDTLDGGAVLPEFKITVGELFPS